MAAESHIEAAEIANDGKTSDGVNGTAVANLSGESHPLAALFSRHIIIGLVENRMAVGSNKIYAARIFLAEMVHTITEKMTQFGICAGKLFGSSLME